MGKYATMTINGETYTTKELFECVDGFKSFGVRMFRKHGLGDSLSLQLEGIQVIKYKDHDHKGGNYYYRIYRGKTFGAWHKTPLTRIIPVLEKLSKRKGWYLSY